MKIAPIPCLYWILDRMTKNSKNDDIINLTGEVIKKKKPSFLFHLFRKRLNTTADNVKITVTYSKINTDTNKLASNHFM